MNETPESEPTQETQPAKGEPVTIPVPSEDEFLENLRKVAKAPEEDQSSS
jgi:hypothetical protein